MAVGNQASDQIDEEIIDTAMARMFNLRNILKLVIDGFNDRALARQQFVFEQDQAVLHVFANHGDELDVVGE